MRHKQEHNGSWVKQDSCLQQALVDAVGHLLIVLLECDAQNLPARVRVRHANLELGSEPGKMYC